MAVADGLNIGCEMHYQNDWELMQGARREKSILCAKLQKSQNQWCEMENASQRCVCDTVMLNKINKKITNTCRRSFMILMNKTSNPTLQSSNRVSHYRTNTSGVLWDISIMIHQELYFYSNFAFLSEFLFRHVAVASLFSIPAYQIQQPDPNHLPYAPQCDGTGTPPASILEV